jgi:alpha-beta hydrolase superfamily lysophospholipase
MHPKAKLSRKRTNRTSNLIRWLATLVTILFLFSNLIIAIQAYAFTHFRSDGLRGISVDKTSLLTWANYLFTGVPIARPENRQTPNQHNLPYEIHTIQLNESEYLEAWYIPHEAPRGIVIGFAGYINRKDSLLTPAAWMHQFGYNVLLVDMRGNGGSSGNDTTLGIREAEDVVAAFNYSQRMWPEQPIILYGVSMGGSAIMRAVAVEQIEPQAIILEGVFDRLLSTARHRFEHIGVPSWPLSELLLFWGSVMVGRNAFSHNPVEYAASIDTPTLLVSGAEDPWVLPAEAEAIFQTLQGPKALQLVEGARHQPPFVFVNEQEWVEYMRAFIDNLE